VSRLEYIHSHNYIHRDVEPQNILMGMGEHTDTVFLVDFGIAKQYCHPLSRIHIPIQDHGQLVGTPAFTSINSHLGLELSHRDDLEALGYTLLFLYSGSLPWLSEHRCRSSAIQQMKESIRSGFHPELPKELLAVISYARSLGFAQKPNYDFLRSILLPAASPPITVMKEAEEAQGVSGADDNTSRV
jgi:serine/threonine protein kinase